MAETAGVVVDLKKCCKRFLRDYQRYCSGEQKGKHADWYVLNCWDGAFVHSKFERNRSEIKGRPEKYHKVMEGGEWMDTHEGFAFDYNGRTIDGYHRSKGLSMCNEGVRVEVLVAFGLHPKTFKYINGGDIRKHQDHVKIGTGDSISRVDVQALSFLIQGKRAASGLFDRSQAADQYVSHKDAIQFVKQHLKDCYSGPVAGVIARAYYQPVFRPHLPAFCEALYDVNQGEDARGGGARARIYLNVTKKLRDYVSKKTGKRIKLDNEEIPLPGEFGACK